VVKGHSPEEVALGQLSRGWGCRVRPLWLQTWQVLWIRVRIVSNGKFGRDSRWSRLDIPFELLANIFVFNVRLRFFATL